MFTTVVLITFLFVFFQRKISKIPWPIAAKFCHMAGSMFIFITPDQKLGASPQKMKAKNAKFGPILDPFPL